MMKLRERNQQCFPKALETVFNKQYSKQNQSIEYFINARHIASFYIPLFYWVGKGLNGQRWFGNKAISIQ